MNRVKLQSKYFKPGIKKINKTEFQGSSCAVPQQTAPDCISDADLTTLDKIIVSLPGADHLMIKSQKAYLNKVYNTIYAATKSLFSCISTEVKIDHDLKIVPSSPLNKPAIIIIIDITSECRVNSITDILRFLHIGLRVFFTHNYYDKYFFDNLLRKLTELSIDIDEKILTDVLISSDKHVNRIAIAKAIESFSLIKKLRNLNHIFSVESPIAGTYDVEPTAKRVAIDVLGGKYMSDEQSYYYFTIKIINFEKIEGRSIFLLDGNPVNVYILDAEFRKNFNNGKIELRKNQRVKAKFKIERSPLTNKIVAYHFTKVELV